MRFQIISLLLVVFFFAACGENKPTEATEDAVAQNENPEVIAPSEVDDLMMQIDGELDKLAFAQSLKYNKEDMSTIEVLAYLDQNNQVRKLVEKQLDGKLNRARRLEFYYNGTVRFASRFVGEIGDENQESYYREVISFYDENGKVTQSKERIASYEEFLEMADFVQCAKESMSEENAMAVINQTGKYETTFQGFVESGPYTFLIVGENVEDGYTSALSIQRTSPTINYLVKEGANALGQKLQIDYERVIDENGYEFQYLVDVALVKTKEEMKEK